MGVCSELIRVSCRLGGLLGVVLFFSVLAMGQEGDRTLSPYFLVKSEAEGVELLPLKSTTADVSIAGVVADVKVTQVYRNAGNSPLEAVYVFPASTRAAVYGMQMTIGERVRRAEIQEKKKAKATYIKAKKAGKSASLLEQHRANVFQMSVANIMPGDEVKVELFYTEHLVPLKGTYEFVYPTVVGPRYSDTKRSEATEGERWVENPYLKSGDTPNYNFDINVDLLAGIAVKEVSSSSHEVVVGYNSEKRAKVSLKDNESFSGDRDYILRYRLQGGKIESGLQLYEGEKENFFLLMMQPPGRVTESNIPPREYVFVVDVSGSMYGFPLETSKKLLRDLIGNLRPVDTFNILTFAGGNSVLWNKSLSATKPNINLAINFLDSKRGGGGTRLLPALKKALALPHDENTSRNFIVVTDGYVSVEAEAFDLIRNNLGNANVFSFGIGSSVNRLLIEGIARAGYGEPAVITKAQETEKAANRFREYIQTPVLTNISLDWDGFNVYDVEPKSIPDVLAERPVVVYGKWKGDLKGKLKLAGFQGDKLYNQELDISSVKPEKSNHALKLLWARNRIATLGDYHLVSHDSKIKEDITKLGLEYSLLTKYTSFVAVDDIVRNETGKSDTVKQPLPLPKGVSNFAVGGNISSVPEPETYLLLFVLGVLGIWYIKPILEAGRSRV